MYRVFREMLLTWPPDGCIMSVGVFMSLFIFHVTVLLVSMLYILVNRLQPIFNVIVYGIVPLVLQVQTVLYMFIHSVISYNIFLLKPKKRKNFPLHHIYVSVYFSTDNMETLDKRVGFDTDSTTYIINNSADAHIWTMNKKLHGILLQLKKSDTSGL